MTSAGASLGKEDRDLGERLFQFALRLVRLCQKLDETGGVGRSLSHQLLRSGTSIGANYEEAQAGQSRADFVSKCSICLKEARETRYWLRLLAASEVIRSDLLRDLIDESDQVTKILGAIVSRTKRNQT